METRTMPAAMRDEIALTYKKNEQAKRDAKKAGKAAKKAEREAEKAKKKKEKEAMEASKKVSADAKAARAKRAYDVISAMPDVVPILKDLRVYKWLCGDTSFLGGRTLKEREAAESAWGEELKQLLSTPTDATTTTFPATNVPSSLMESSTTTSSKSRARRTSRLAQRAKRSRLSHASMRGCHACLARKSG